MPSRYNLRQKFIDLISRSDRREFEEIRQIAQDFCDGNLTQDEFKARYGESKASKKKLPSLAAHDLTLQQVRQILKIKPTSGDDELANVQSCPIPTELQSVLEKVNAARSNSPINEANIRWTLDLLLIYAHDIVTCGQPNAGQAISIQTERHWVLPVKFEKRDMNLVGKPDYAVWYGNANDTAVNVVVVEAKGMGNASQGMTQCLAYMGMVHRLRRQEKKQNCTVYGMAADSELFLFLKINERSKYSSVPIFAAEGKYEKVLGLLVYLLRKAREASPTHSKESSAQSHTKESSRGSLYASEDCIMSDR